MPLRPRAASSPMPPTTGGNTMGSTAIDRSTLRPRKRARARTHASGPPNSIASNDAQTETITDSRKAVQAPLEERAEPALDQGALTTSRTAARQRKAAATDAEA